MTPIATKNNAIILKDGKAAESCGCCGCPAIPSEIAITFTAPALYYASVVVDRVAISGQLQMVYYIHQPIASAFHGDRYSGTVQLARVPGPGVPTWTYEYDNGAGISCVYIGIGLGAAYYQFTFNLPIVRHRLDEVYYFANQGQQPPTFTAGDFSSYDDMYDFDQLDGGYGVTSDPLGWYGVPKPSNDSGNFDCYIDRRIGVVCEPSPTSSDPYFTGRTRYWKTMYFFSQAFGPQFRTDVYPSIAVDSTPFSVYLTDNQNLCSVMMTHNELLGTAGRSGDGRSLFSETTIAGSVYRGEGTAPTIEFSSIEFID
jgi:hypothetical protein